MIVAGSVNDSDVLFKTGAYVCAGDFLLISAYETLLKRYMEREDKHN